MINVDSFCDGMFFTELLSVWESDGGFRFSSLDYSGFC